MARCRLISADLPNRPLAAGGSSRVNAQKARPRVLDGRKVEYGSIKSLKPRRWTQPAHPNPLADTRPHRSKTTLCAVNRPGPIPHRRRCSKRSRRSWQARRKTADQPRNAVSCLALDNRSSPPGSQAEHRRLAAPGCAADGSGWPTPGAVCVHANVGRRR